MYSARSIVMKTIACHLGAGTSPELASPERTGWIFRTPSLLQGERIHDLF